MKFSAQHEANLRQLAAHLLSLPEGYESFDISSFVKIKVEDRSGIVIKTLDLDEVTPEVYTQCGTVACAVGHAPLAGLDCSGAVDWWELSENLFGMGGESFEWSWCFSADWAYRDNTPQGAGKRIIFMLDNADFSHLDHWKMLEMQDGEIPLCYV